MRSACTSSAISTSADDHRTPVRVPAPRHAHTQNPGLSPFSSPWPRLRRVLLGAPLVACRGRRLPIPFGACPSTGGVGCCLRAFAIARSAAGFGTILGAFRRRRFRQLGGASSSCSSLRSSAVLLCRSSTVLLLFQCLRGFLRLLHHRMGCRAVVILLRASIGHGLGALRAWHLDAGHVADQGKSVYLRAERFSCSALLNSTQVQVGYATTSTWRPRCWLFAFF